MKLKRFQGFFRLFQTFPLLLLLLCKWHLCVSESIRKAVTCIWTSATQTCEWVWHQIISNLRAADICEWLPTYFILQTNPLVCVSSCCNYPVSLQGPIKFMSCLFINNSAAIAAEQNAEGQLQQMWSSRDTSKSYFHYELIWYDYWCLIYNMWKKRL